MAAIVIARRPEEVAHEVERMLGDGFREFVIRRIDRGGMLDMERLGAARYAAGLHSSVELEDEISVRVAATR